MLAGAATFLLEILTKQRYKNNLLDALTEAVSLKAANVSAEWQECLRDMLQHKVNDDSISVEDIWVKAGWLGSGPGVMSGKKGIVTSVSPTNVRIGETDFPIFGKTR